MLAARLGQRLSYEASLTRGSMYPQYRDTESSDMAIEFNRVAEKAYALLNSSTQVSNDDWRGLFEEFSRSPK